MTGSGNKIIDACFGSGPAINTVCSECSECENCDLYVESE